MNYILYLKSGQDWNLANNEYGYYTGKTWTHDGEYFPVFDKQITMRTKHYSTRQRAEKALETLRNKCEYVTSNSRLEEVPDNKKTVWAIYSTEFGGLYAKEYINSMEKCKNLLGGHYIKETDTPVVVNRVGGRCSFYPVEDNFVGFRESENYPLTREECYPKNSDKFHYGWIDLDGNTYACGFEDHYESASMLCEENGLGRYSGERKLEELGWIKITRPTPYNLETMNLTVPYFMGKYITKKQADTLFDIGLYDHKYVQRWIKRSEDRW